MSHVKKRVSNLSIPIMVLILLILTAVYHFSGMSLDPVGTLIPGARKDQVFRPTGARVAYDNNSQPFFYSNGSSNFYFATRDGISYVTSDGQTKWNYVYNLSQPIVRAVKDIVAVSEIGGRYVYVFNAGGKLYEKDFEQQILYISINRLGYLVLLLKRDNDYETMVYDTSGMLIFEHRHQDYNIYPVSSDVSGDGRIVATNILDVGGLQINSSLSFTYADGSSRSAFAARNKENQLINLTRFIENNIFVSVSDSEISVYDIGGDNYIRDIATVTLNNKLSWFGFMGERGFAAVLGQGLLNKRAEPENTVLFYNSSATEMGRYELDKPITYFHAGADAVIAGSYSGYYAISDRGVLLWEFVVPEDVRQMIFLGNNDTILLASNNEAVVYKRTRQ